VDTVALEHQLHHELAGGVHGLLMLGTIGEGEYVTPEERAQVVATAVRVAGGRVPVVVGIHTCDLEVARAQLLQARDLGAAAVLIKYIGRPKASAAEVLGFYAALAEMKVLPIFYYHYPRQTRLKLTPDDIAAIVSLPGIAGIKESTLNLSEVKAHVERTRGQGKVFMGATALYLTQFLELGGHGIMCPEAVLLPVPTVQAYEAYKAGHTDEARAIQKELFVLVPVLKKRPRPPALTRMVMMTAADHKWPIPTGIDNPQARMKAALTCLGIATSLAVKCPLPPLTEHERRRVQRTMKQVERGNACSADSHVAPEPLKTSLDKEGCCLLLRPEGLLLAPTPFSLSRWPN
jgi:4-hydroxy-tetrahydrodipicolinate synthase